MQDVPTLEMSRQDFDAHVGRTFRPRGGEVVLTLDRIETGPPAPAGHREGFSLIFRSPQPGPVLQEGGYVFAVEGGADCTLYVMPVHTPQLDRQEYQAVFN